jgi:hypothetical protein
MSGGTWRSTSPTASLTAFTFNDLGLSFDSDEPSE